jgi:hypothetical protein
VHCIICLRALHIGPTLRSPHTRPETNCRLGSSRIFLFLASKPQGAIKRPAFRPPFPTSSLHSEWNGSVLILCVHLRRRQGRWRLDVTQCFLWLYSTRNSSASAEIVVLVGCRSWYTATPSPCWRAVELSRYSTVRLMFSGFLDPPSTASDNYRKIKQFQCRRQPFIRMSTDSRPLLNWENCHGRNLHSLTRFSPGPQMPWYKTHKGISVEHIFNGSPLLPSCCCGLNHVGCRRAVEEMEGDSTTLSSWTKA